MSKKEVSAAVEAAAREEPEKDLGEPGGGSEPRTVQGPMELNDILDEIEAKPIYYAAKLPALVKALRRAMLKIDYELPCWRHELKREIASILKGKTP